MAAWRYTWPAPSRPPRSGPKSRQPVRGRGFESTSRFRQDPSTSFGPRHWSSQLLRFLMATRVTRPQRHTILCVSTKDISIDGSGDLRQASERLVVPPSSERYNQIWYAGQDPTINSSGQDRRHRGEFSKALWTRK